MSGNEFSICGTALGFSSTSGPKFLVVIMLFRKMITLQSFWPRTPAVEGPFLSEWFTESSSQLASFLTWGSVPRVLQQMLRIATAEFVRLESGGSLARLNCYRPSEQRKKYFLVFLRQIGFIPTWIFAFLRHKAFLSMSSSSCRVRR